MTKQTDLSDTVDLLYDARNLVDALRLVVHVDEDPRSRHQSESVRADHRRHIIESMAGVAVGKIDAALGGAFLDPPISEARIAKAKAYMVKTGGLPPDDAASKEAEAGGSK